MPVPAADSTWRCGCSRKNASCRMPNRMRAASCRHSSRSASPCTADRSSGSACSAVIGTVAACSAASCLSTTGGSAVSGSRSASLCGTVCWRGALATSSAVARASTRSRAASCSASRRAAAMPIRRSTACGAMRVDPSFAVQTAWALHSRSPRRSSPATLSAARWWNRMASAIRDGSSHWSTNQAPTAPWSVSRTERSSSDRSSSPWSRARIAP